MNQFDILKLMKSFGYINNQVIPLKSESLSNDSFAIEINNNEEGIALWEKFDEIKNDIELFPVLYAGFSHPDGIENWKEIISYDDLFSRFSFELDNSRLKCGVTTKEIIEKAIQEEFESIIIEHDENASMYLLDSLENEFYSFKPKSDSNRMMKQAEEMILSGENCSYIKFNKWLLNREEKNGGKELIEDGYMGWFNPEGLRQSLLLLPLKNNYEMLAYLHFDGSETYGSAKAIAMLRYWNDKYGAEIVGHYGTMLNIKIKVLPETIGDALDLAIQQESFAEGTTVLAGINIRDHARILMKKKQWFLHQRP